MFPDPTEEDPWVNIIKNYTILKNHKELSVYIWFLYKKKTIYTKRWKIGTT